MTTRDNAITASKVVRLPDLQSTPEDQRTCRILVDSMFRSMNMIYLRPCLLARVAVLQIGEMREVENNTNTTFAGIPTPTKQKP